MYKSKALFLIVFIVFNLIVVKSDIEASELYCLRWFIQQFGLDWSLTSADCTQISSNPERIKCIRDADQVDHISSFTTYSYNSTYDLLQLIDQSENVNLNSISLSFISFSDYISIFPVNLNHLTSLSLSFNFFKSDLTSSIFKPPMARVILNENTFGSGTFKIKNDGSTFDSMDFLFIRLYNLGLNSLDFNAAQWPVLKTLSTDQKLPYTLNIASNSIENLILDQYPLSPAPPAKWFAPNFSLSMKNSFFEGDTVDYGSRTPNLLSYKNNTKLGTVLFDSNCYSFYNSDCNLTSPYVPDCFYCYWEMYLSSLPPNTNPPPAGFHCNFTVDKSLYYVPSDLSLKSILISGNNIGLGYDAKNLSVNIPNKLLTYRLPSSQGKATLQFSPESVHRFDIVWGVEPKIQRAGYLYVDETYCEFYISGRFNMYSNFTVQVYNQTCNNVQVNSTTITCNMPIAKANYYNITVDDTITNLFIDTGIYVPPEQNNCGVNDQCNGKGALQGGGVIVNPSPTSPEPTIIVEDKIKFKFDIASIQEIDSDSSIVNEVFTSKWNSTTITIDTLTTYNYYITVNSTSTSINATIEQSTKDRVVEFGGYPTTYAAGSLKLTIKINNWSYKDKLNHLRVIMTTTIENTKDDCDSDTIADGQDINDINYLKVMMNDKTFYGRFLPYSVVDNGRVVKVNNQLINTTVSTVLVNTDRSGDSRCRSESRKWLIPTIVVVVVAYPNKADREFDSIFKYERIPKNPRRKTRSLDLTINHT
ncbi:hypothetical protein PPL_02399 [Heterostelium album PN500]|uniref:Uncharacterized protein n=1 Tax=Heterostelium pallidum (strain ATCC 26659 / Pp 5 / PN500) TaxID=670386 RepID=D3AZL7_HETP5|nr:hypothetical protein PPL_02399 [Heterostelium album PN500]EFA85396.1 hypothetical protein PPL_02399 [Heterostelium album PN500]|eukprot:XP_020437505.1 hypothetical protein PPL_02399 [Heterostelium album PN500]